MEKNGGKIIFARIQSFWVNKNLNKNIIQDKSTENLWFTFCFLVIFKQEYSFAIREMRNAKRQHKLVPL